MKIPTSLIALPLLATAFGAASAGLKETPARSPARPTAVCNAAPTISQVRLRYNVATNDAFALSVIAAVEDPASNPTLHERLGKPVAVDYLHIIDARIVLDYEAIQDPSEMSNRLKDDPQLASTYRDFNASRGGCDFLPLPAGTQVIREYYNAGLNHFYLSGTPAEMTWLDQGGGGGGWVRTGQAWTTHVASEPGCLSPTYDYVYMFAGTPGIGPNSHYFTANPAECGYLRNTIGWSYIAAPFGAKRPVDGVCPSDAPVGLKVLYNNRAAENDSNHRYTSDQAIYDQMLAYGWTGYDAQLCVKAVGAN